MQLYKLVEVLLGRIGDSKRSFLGYLIVDKETSIEYGLLLRRVSSAAIDIPDVGKLLMSLPPKIDSNHLFFCASLIVSYVVGLPLLFVCITYGWKSFDLRFFAFIYSGLFWFFVFVLIEKKKIKQMTIRNSLFQLRELLRRNNI
jgi:hypothetical protein